MSKVYFTSLDSAFAKALAALYAAEGFEVVTEAVPGIEYFIVNRDVMNFNDM